MDKTTAILTAIFTAALCLPVFVALIIFANEQPQDKAILYSNSTCMGVVKDIIIENGQTKIVTSKGIFIYDDEGNLVKEKLK